MRAEGVDRNLVVARLRAGRALAMSNGDLRLVAQLEDDLRRWGAGPVEVEAALPEVTERAVPEPMRRGPGRPRKDI